MPDSVSENNEVKLLWDMNIQRDHVIEARTPDIVVVNKQERKCAIVDTAVPGDKRIGEKENEKVEKYQELNREIARMWNMRTVRVIPIVIREINRLLYETLDIRIIIIHCTHYKSSHWLRAYS